MKILTRLSAFALAVALLGALPLAASGIMPLSEVKKGMKGYGLTIFEGQDVEKFDVEILGVLPDIGPEQDLILAKVDSDLLRHSGVIAGMSGSPIFVDGKMIGALAYSWQFAKDPVAGITPIESMLALEQNGGGVAKAVPSRVSATTFLNSIVAEGLPSMSELFSALNRTSSSPAAALPIAVPLSLGKFESDTLERFRPMFEASGFLPVPSGSAASGSGGAANTADHFQPGDAVGAVLLDGDFSVAATGTVTHIDGDRIYAFGHPFLDLGAIDFPMAKSEIVAVLPSVARSFKFSNSGQIVGSFRQDRAAGIMGYLGESSQMIPVEVTLEGSRGEQAYKFRMARHSLLSPLLLAMVADSVVAGAQRAAGERTVILDSELEIEGFAPIRLREGWAGAEARQAIPAYLAVVSSYLMSNEFTDAEIRSVKMRLRHEDDLRIAKLMEAWIETPADGEVNPGDVLKVRTLLKPFRGEPFTETFELRVPVATRPGDAHLFVSGGRIANRLDFSLVPPDPRTLKQVVDVIERLRSSTDLTVALYSANDGAVSAGVFHPNLPPSIHAVVTADSTNASIAPVKYHAPASEARTLDYIVDGAVKIDLKIVPAS